MERVEVDFLDLPSSYGDGYTHILVVVDVFTRYGVFIPSVTPSRRPSYGPYSCT